MIIDKRGVLIADGGHYSKPGSSLEERRAAAGRAFAAEGVISAKATDAGTGWTVISEVPTDAALGPAATFRGVVTSNAPTSTEQASIEQAITNRLEALRDVVPEGLVSRLVTSFLKRAPDYIAVLRDTLQRGDADAFANAAHSLKGIAANLGAETCADLCAELETCGRDDHLEPAPDLLDRLRVEYDAARRIFQELAVRPGMAMPPA